MHHSKRFGATLALGLLLALAGCNRQETPPAAPPIPPPAPSMAPAPFAVKSVSLGKAIGADKRVTSPTSSFAATDTIYASVATEGAAPSVTLTARWTYQDGQVVDETSETIAPSGPAATEFHIAKPDGWPAGSYKVEISANGMPTTSQTFTVVQ